MNRRSISVKRRLSALVVIEALSALVLLVVAFSAFGRIISHTRYTHRFVIEPLVAIGSVMEATGELRSVHSGDAARSQRLLDMFEEFTSHYRGEWQLIGSTNPDALRQAEELRRASRYELAEQERAAVDEFDAATQSLAKDLRTHASEERIHDHTLDVRAALHKLLAINLRFAEISKSASERLMTETLWWMGVLGLASVASSVFLGVRVRKAIAPRIDQLVAKVRRFQESGVNEPIPHPGTDELAVLNNAIDIGFASIISRDRDRDRFLAIAAHELKTPLSNIRGFTQAAIAYPERTEMRNRALEVIARQTDRIVRLVDDLFLVSRARTHDLPFAPSPLELGAVVAKVAAELEAHHADTHLVLDTEAPARLLADEALVSQALWTMLSYAMSRAGPGTTVSVRVLPSEAEAVVSISGFGPPLTTDELCRLFEPFASVEYEGAAERSRNVLGLYLCHEIAKVHGGFLRAYNQHDGLPVLTLNLPA